MSFKPDYIVPELKATERFAAIRELLGHLIQVGAIPPRLEDSMFAAFCRREETMTTGVGSGIAAPNIISDDVTEEISVMGQSSSGVDFASLDGKPVKTVILTIRPKFKHSETDQNAS